MSFFEDVSTLCAQHLNKGRKGGSPDQMAEVVEALATMLGRTIAIGTNGDPKLIDELLIGSEDHIARSAAEHAEFINSISKLKGSSKARR